MANMMYHPVYCPHGTMKASDGKFWYETSLSIKSLYDCIVNAGTVNGRPDSKVADKVYYESNGGLVFLPTYAKSPSKHDLLEEETQKLVSGDTDMALDMGVECKKQYRLDNQASIDVLSATTCVIYDDTLWLNRLAPKGSVCFLNMHGVLVLLQHTGVFFGDEIQWSVIGTNTLVGSGLYLKTPSYYVVGVYSSPYLLTQGKALSTDVIGNPSPYVAADALYTVPTTVNITNMPTSTLVWDEATGKMYKALVATNDIDANGVPVPAFTDTASWVEVQKGYPVDWRNRLAGGKALPFNPLLVGENGEDYIPSTVTKPVKYSNKILTSYNRVFAYEGTPARTFFYGGGYGGSINHINNSANIDASPGSMFLHNYTSHNTPLVKSTPKPVELVQPKAIASNSHSWYKGAGIVNAVTGKVSVGDGTNGLESRVLENAEVGADYMSSNTELGSINGIPLKLGTIVETVKGRTGANPVTKVGEFYKWVYADNYLSTTVSDYLGSTDFGGAAWVKVPNISTTPQHNTITLDAANSPASKAFTTLAVDDNGEYVVQVFGEELAYNATTTAYDGHTSDFTQLTNRTLTDLNGAQVKTTVAIQRTGVYKGDK